MVRVPSLRGLGAAVDLDKPLPAAPAAPPEAAGPPEPDMFAKLSELSTMVTFESGPGGSLTILSNPAVMRATFALKYLQVQNYGDFRVVIPPEKIDQWIREAEQKLAAKGGAANRSLVNELKDKLKGVGAPAAPLLALLNGLQNFPDRLVFYPPPINRVADSKEWQDAFAMTMNVLRIAGEGLKSLAAFFGTNLDITGLLLAIGQAIFFIGDYVREQYKAEIELAARDQSKKRYDATMKAYKDNFGFEPSWVTLSAWGRHSDPLALPDGTTGKYLRDKKAFDDYTARYATTANTFNVRGRTGNAGSTNDLRVATVLVFDIAKAYKLKSFKDVLEKFRSPGGGSVGVEIYDVARPSGKNDLVRVVKGKINDDWYMPWWEDTIVGNYNHDEQNRDARRRADQLALSDRFWKAPRNDLAAAWFMPFYNSIPGNDDDKWRWLNANYASFMARIGGASPEQIAIFFASGGRWEKPVAPVKDKPKRCPTGGDGCVPFKQIVGRAPIGSKDLPPLPKAPKQMSAAEKTTFIGACRSAGFPDYYIEAILLKPEDWYEGVSAGGGLAGLGEGDSYSSWIYPAAGLVTVGVLAFVWYKDRQREKYMRGG